MRIYGQFRDVDNQLINVEIVTNGSTAQQVEIDAANGLYFAGEEPVIIECQIDSTFDHIIKKSAKISLITEDYMGGDLYAYNTRSCEVTITKGNNCLFWGFAEPNTYNQGFANPKEAFEINCVDALSTLENYKYNGVTINNFDTKRRAAKNKTFRQLLMDSLNGVVNECVYYDASKGVTSNRVDYVFDDLSVSELYIIGEDYDDTWTREEVLEELLRYLNLHIVQIGKSYYIFDWNSLKNGGYITWTDLISGDIYDQLTPLVTLTNAMHAADDTNITVSEVYNQIQVKDILESMETIIVSPLDKDDLNSLYSGKQLYMTEYISEGSGDRAHDAMIAMVNGNAPTYDQVAEIDWYLQAMYNHNWKFYVNGSQDVNTINDYVNGSYINQWKMAKYLTTHRCPYIFKLGCVERKPKATDNSPTSKIDMSPYLYLSVNGNEVDAQGSQSPNDSELEAMKPIAEYVGSSVGSYSPIDDETTNYLVFSGKMLLQPIVYESGQQHTSRTNNYETIRLNGMRKTEGETAIVPFYGAFCPSTAYVNNLADNNNLVKSDNNEEGRYYTRKFYTLDTPNASKPYSYLTDGTKGIQPWTKDKSAHGYKFSGMSLWDSSDQVSKIPILECELIIGTKRLIETNIDQYGNSTFEWVALGSEPSVTYNGQTYTITTFTLGINPKIDDYIIGDEFDLQNTIDWSMNLDAEGTAIPIKKSDQLSGAVIFRILGPVNITWNTISYRHPLWFEHIWQSYYRFLLSHVENIIIKDFECKIYSDNAGNELNKEKDLIYISDEQDAYVNKKDDIDFKFITQLSSQEAFQKGLYAGINQNAVYNNIANEQLQSIYNATTNETAKAEEHYIDQYYNEYSTPRIQMTTTLHNGNNINFFNRYRSNPLNKSFYVIGENYDVKNNNKTLTIKEI